MKKQLLIIALLCAGVSTVSATNLTTNSGDNTVVANFKVSNLAQYAQSAHNKYTALYAPVKRTAKDNLETADTQISAQNTLNAFNNFADTKQGKDLAKTLFKADSSVLRAIIQRLIEEDSQAVHEALAVHK